MQNMSLENIVQAEEEQILCIALRAGRQRNRLVINQHHHVIVAGSSLSKAIVERGRDSWSEPASNRRIDLVQGISALVEPG